MSGPNYNAYVWVPTHNEELSAAAPPSPPPPGHTYDQTGSGTVCHHTAGVAASNVASPSPPPPPPPPPPPEEGYANTDRQMIKGSSSSTSIQHPFFDSSHHNSEVYQQTSMAGFPVAGQEKDGGVVSSSEFKACTSMKADGVQHGMSCSWKKMGESGQNSTGRQWFEKRGQTGGRSSKNE